MALSEHRSPINLRYLRNVNYRIRNSSNDELVEIEASWIGRSQQVWSGHQHNLPLSALMDLVNRKDVARKLSANALDTERCCSRCVLDGDVLDRYYGLPVRTLNICSLPGYARQILEA